MLFTSKGLDIVAAAGDFTAQVGQLSAWETPSLNSRSFSRLERPFRFSGPGGAIQSSPSVWCVRRFNEPVPIILFTYLWFLMGVTVNYHLK